MAERLSGDSVLSLLGFRPNEDLDPLVSIGIDEVAREITVRFGFREKTPPVPRPIIIAPMIEPVFLKSDGSAETDPDPGATGARLAIESWSETEEA